MNRLKTVTKPQQLLHNATRQLFCLGDKQRYSRLEIKIIDL